MEIGVKRHEYVHRLVRAVAVALRYIDSTPIDDARKSEAANVCDILRAALEAEVGR